MNIYDIAKEAGVSPATVSRVLNGNLKVSDVTRNKVQKVIAGKQYVPNATARNLSVGETSNIAFIVPDIENPFFSRILHGISDRASENDYNIFMFGTSENVDREHKALENLRAQNIRGIIIVPVATVDTATEERLHDFEKQGVPVVLVDRDIKGGQFDGIFSDDEPGAYDAVSCLIKAGHSKIATICGPDTSRPGRERLKGYKRALVENKITLRDDYIQCGLFKEDESYKCMKTLMEMADRPTAVFTCNNMTTLGCLRYMNEAGLKLKKDVSLVAFDDIEVLAYTGMYLSAVTRPIYEMGYEAMGLLEDRFRNRRDNDNNVVIRRNIVKTGFVKRGSEERTNFGGKRNE